MSERREGVQRVPRSGGRTTERASSMNGSSMNGTSVNGGTSGSGARGARRYPTQGTAALKLDAAEPMRVTEPIRGTEPIRATESVEPKLRVAPPAPVSAPRAPFVAVVIAIVVAGVFGILLINTKTNENTFQIDRLQDQKAALDSQQQDLEAKLTEFNNPGSLRAMAKKLGLVESDSFAYIRLPDGKVIGVPKPATDAPAITSQNTEAPAAGTAPGTGTGASTVQGGGTAQGTGR